jgi:actin-like ATPase involved in cell morphogenesis
VTVGEAAAGLAGIDPTRVVRALKRRVGDPDPVVLGGHPWTPEDLSARLLRWVVDRVIEHQNGPPERIALAHPASWSAHTLERLAAALAGQDLDVAIVAEPHAVAHAAAGATSPGDTVGVHDLGGGRFDAAVLRREGLPARGFAMLGVPETIADLGGLDLDELVWQHVRVALPDDVAPVARVRRACTRAKETLSDEDEVVVRIRRGDCREAVRLDRATFEGLIAPQVNRTVAALRRTIASAGLEPGQLAALLLVGGSARIPLVARTVTEQLGCVPTVYCAPDLVASGAVLALAASNAVVDAAAPGTRAFRRRAGRTPGSADNPTDVTGRATSPTVDAEPPSEAPTVVLAVPAAMDVPTTPFGTPAVVAPPPALDRPAPAASVPASPAPASRRSSGRGRTTAVLDPAARRAGRRSLARTLVGVGAVLVAAIILVALFRPDGPLDPPLDPVAGDGASRIVVPVPAAVAPPAGAPIPTATEIGGDLEADRPSAAVRPAAGPPADPRPSVTTTPPPAPRALPDDVPPSAEIVGAGAPRTGMTPPTPAV